METMLDKQCHLYPIQMQGTVMYRKIKAVDNQKNWTVLMLCDTRLIYVMVTNQPMFSSFQPHLLKGDHLPLPSPLILHWPMEEKVTWLYLRLRSHYIPTI